MNWLESNEIVTAIGDFLAEDIGRGDITTSSTVPEDVRGVGRFLAKEYLVICGMSIAEAVFVHLDPETPELETAFNDGDEVEEGTIFGSLSGYADVLLTGERVALICFSGCRCCYTHAAICPSGGRNRSTDRRYAKNNAGPANAGKIRGDGRRRQESPDGPG